MTPIRPAESRRVETDERRRWWELGLALAPEDGRDSEVDDDNSEVNERVEFVELEKETDAIELFREWERV